MSNDNKTLQDLLSERVALFCASEKPVELIDSAIEKLMKDLMDNAFRSYGDFADKMKEAIKAALPANVQDFIQLEKYNAIIAETLRKRWHDAAQDSSLVENAHKVIDQVLSKDGLIGKEIKLSKLIEEFIDQHKEEASEEHWEAPEFRMQKGDDGFIHLYFDPEPEDHWRQAGYSRGSRSDYDLKHALHLRIEETIEPVQNWKQPEYKGQIYSAKLDDKKISLDLNLYHKWEQILAALYFGNAILHVDCDPEDFSYGLYG